ncbi:MAG: DUF72 domain-containing protein, partial [Candidatus Eremiobacteraeota bacterium]|nr:DUF72 domain-containing protein [Candidatus Eremiobacteraeota bacterium]
MGSVRVGTSGWVYRDWRDRFYPPGLAQPCWLSYYAAHFDTVELNATTYRLPTESQIRRWCDLVPDAFRYTVKLSRLITHRRSMPERLDRFLHNYFQRASCFVPAKLAQVLVQFPPYLARDDTRLESFFDKLPPGYRYVVEFRHESWFAQPVRELLARRNIALCIHDYPGMRVPTWITSDTLAYVRFHGAVGLYVGSYSKRALRRWASRLR